MRPITHGIAAVTFVACLSTFTYADQLQWVQSSPSGATQQTVARPISSARQAVQPTFRQPPRFKQPESARPISRTTKRAPKQPTQVSERRIAERTRVGVLPAQHTAEAAAEELPPATSKVAPPNVEYQMTPQANSPVMMSGPMMNGPYYSGPEPTCGCAGPCGCGDGCFLGEPGCGAGDVCFEATCAAGICGDTCCGDPCCGDGCCDPGCGCPTGCGDGCCDSCCDSVPWPAALFGFESRGCTPILWIPPLKECTVFAGVQGHKGPLDNGRDGGNFGFHQGFNLGGKMAWIPWHGLGYQIGYRATQNQLHGDANSGTGASHTQQFLTAGLFMRNRYGWRYGVVWDFLRDRRQGDQEYGQVRGQIGWRNCHNREFGFQFTSHSNDRTDQGGIVNTPYQAAEQYRLYYQIFGNQGGNVRAFAGLTGNSEGILGTDFHVPINHRWAFAGNWTYLIPEDGSNGTSAEREAWNLGMSLVWHYGCRAKGYSNRPYMPMFDVADNGSMIIRRP